MALLILKALECRRTSRNPRPETCLLEITPQEKPTLYQHTMQSGEQWPLNRKVSFDSRTTVRLWSQDMFGAGDDDAFLGETHIQARQATDARRAFRIDGAVYELLYDVRLATPARPKSSAASKRRAATPRRKVALSALTG